MRITIAYNLRIDDSEKTAELLSREDVERLSGPLVHPMVTERLKGLPYEPDPASLVRTRLLRPLEDFGLIQHHVVGKRGHREIDEIRKTKLFDKFLRFEPGPEEPHPLAFPEQPDVVH